MCMCVYTDRDPPRTFLRNWVKFRIKFSLVPSAVKSSRVHGEKRLGKLFDAAFAAYLRVPFYCVRANITVAEGVFLFLFVTYTRVYSTYREERNIDAAEIGGA